MTSRGASAVDPKIICKFIRHWNQLWMLNENKNLTLLELTTKLLLILSHLITQNEHDTANTMIPHCITCYDLSVFFPALDNVLKTINVRIHFHVGRSKKIIDADSWQHVHPVCVLGRVQGIRQALTKLFPPTYTWSHFHHASHKLVKPRMRCRAIASNIANRNMMLVVLEDILVGESMAFQCRLKFVKKLEQKGSLAQVLADCPDEVCAICRDKKLKEISKFAALDCCQHLCCVSCVTKWFEQSRTCPLCRGAVAYAFSSCFISDTLLRTRGKIRAQALKKSVFILPKHSI